jgi:hypothetical protein
MRGPRPPCAGWRGAVLASLATAAYHTPLEAAAPAPLYLVDTSRAGEGRVSLALKTPATARSKATRVSPRDLAVGAKSVIEGVACDGTPLLRDGAAWSLTEGCRDVTWTVALKTAGNNVAADDQSGIFFESGWGILPDTAFLRLEGWNGDASVRIVDGDGSTRSETLPPLDTAPALFVIGQPPAVEVASNGVALVYMGERLDEVLGRMSPQQHLAGLSYLRAITGADDRAGSDRFTVVWLPSLRSARGLGGAAGANASLINYYPASERPTAQEALMPFVILLHEQFHQLAPGGMPLWASESLAQYFALKAATRTAPDGEAIAGLWEQLAGVAPDAPNLLDVQRQVIEHDDPANYGLFYSKGAMFWHELELALQQASMGSLTLDSILPQVFESGFEPNGTLSASLRATLNPIADREMQRLLDDYLGH